MKQKKIRRESGRSYNKFYDPEKGYYFEQYWDDWNDHRDGFRNAGYDGKKIAPDHLKKERWGISETNRNKKLKKLLNRRKLRKNIYKNK